jgi:hypothetical protein
MRRDTSLLFLTLFFSAFCLAASPSAAQQIAIEAQVGNGAWQTATAVEVLYGQKVALRISPTPNTMIRWFQIVPDIGVRYNNAVWPWLPNAYQWKGYDQIRYNKVHLKEFDGSRQIELFSLDLPASQDEPWAADQDSIFSYFKRRLLSPETDKRQFFNKALGSFWYQAEILDGKRTYSTPGIEAIDRRGLSPKVFRLSVRRGNDLLGHLTTYLNVPAVFGSTPYQVKNHIGIDCADVLMAAYAKWKQIPITKDYNVAMLTTKFPVVIKTSIENGRPDSSIRWGRDIRKGDFIAVKYSGSRQYQHIGALYKDQNKNGQLDEADLILHAGPDPLHWSKLAAGQFDGTVVILRPS